LISTANVKNHNLAIITKPIIVNLPLILITE